MLRESWPYAGCLVVSLAALWLPRPRFPGDWSSVQLGAWLVLACAAIGIARNLHRPLRAASRAPAGTSCGHANDPLTGLLHRAGFEQRVERRSGHVPHALLFVDVDQFRVVNHACGHEVGDALLRRVAAVLQGSLRDGDVVGRLGADEFGVLLPGCRADDAALVADKLCRALAGARFVHDGRSFPMGASIGVVELGGQWRQVSAALDAAEAACGLAKEHGRNRVHLHRAGDAELALREGMLQWVERIQHALDHGRLCLYAQPIAPAVPQAEPAVHIELLLRMLDEQGRVVAPTDFLPAAERFGMMSAIDRWVVAAAFERLGAAASAPALCAINLSASSLCDEHFLEFVLAERQRHGVQASGVCFEITETAVISHFPNALRCIERLRETGFRFALDDFGTGMSSFAYLKRLPVDFLKIDGAFVKDMLNQPVDLAMVEAINHIGHVLGLRTVAEFVEDDDIRRRLGDIGVDFVQGYGIGRPAPF